jgi:hypothetical protein
VVGEKVRVCGGLVEGRVRCCRRRASGRICVVGEKRRQWVRRRVSGNKLGGCRDSQTDQKMRSTETKLKKSKRYIKHV